MLLSTELLNKIVESNVGWDVALLDAEEQIADAEKRIAQLKGTASVIRKMIVAGEPWPGSQPDATRN
jgi:hypothetical protein